jgi:hypothetical protein
MEWTTELLDRLYPCYEEHYKRLRAGIVAANRSLGSPHPERVKLQCLTRTEFEDLLRGEPFDIQARKLWIRSLLRGQEQEFPELLEFMDDRQAAIVERSRSASKRQRMTA